MQAADFSSSDLNDDDGGAVMAGVGAVITRAMREQRARDQFDLNWWVWCRIIRNRTPGSPSAVPLGRALFPVEGVR